MKSFMGIFTWDGWDEIGNLEMYYSCVLEKNVGDYKEGDEFAIIYFNKTCMKLCFYKNEDDEEPVMWKGFVFEG